MPHPSQLLTYKKQLTLTRRLKPYCHLGFVKLWSAYPVYAYHLLPVKEVTANETILYPKDLIHKINLEVLNYQKHCLLNCLSPAFLFLDQLPGIPSVFCSFLLFFILSFLPFILCPLKRKFYFHPSEAATSSNTVYQTSAGKERSGDTFLHFQAKPVSLPTATIPSPPVIHPLKIFRFLLDALV